MMAETLEERCLNALLPSGDTVHVKLDLDTVHTGPLLIVSSKLECFGELSWVLLLLAKEDRHKQGPLTDQMSLSPHHIWQWALVFA